jgi:Helix-turn-helix.
MLLLIKLYSEDMNEAVAEVLRDLREENHISQEKLADAIGSHQVYISEIEKGKKLPSLQVLYHIAKFYNMTLTQLVERIELRLPKA